MHIFCASTVQVLCHNMTKNVSFVDYDSKPLNFIDSIFANTFQIKNQHIKAFTTLNGKNTINSSDINEMQMRET